MTIGTEHRIQMMEDMVVRLNDIDEGLHRELDNVDKLHILLLGSLTEDICPIELIAEIVKQADVYGLAPVELAWYYQNVKVEPLMIEDSKMVYTIDLPFIKHNNYNRYSISIYPVPLNDSGLEVQVIAKPDIASHATAGFWFVPCRCRRFRPELCHTGPLYAKKISYKFERGLITGHTQDTMNCALTTDILRWTEATEIDNEEYILRTQGETYTMSCRDRRQVKQFLSIRIYLVTLPGDCTLTGRGWQLNGKIHKFLTAQAEIDTIRIRHLDLYEMIQQNDIISNQSIIELPMDYTFDGMNDWMDMDMN